MRASPPLSPHLKTEKERRQITTLPARNGGRELAKKYKVTWSSLFIVQHKYGKETDTAVGIAFMMAVVGLSLPEAAMLKKAMTWQLILIFFSTVALFIILSGFLFNAIL